ncbi:MAG TPA: hypothetical protein PKM78_12780 [Anaerolineae bacterium]|nr:hypothetical protein [Anaerolineae bacterium]
MPDTNQRPALLRLLPYLLLAAILALAAALRFYRLGAVAFTFDAAAVSNLAVQWIDQGRLPLQGMVSSTGFRNPPLTVWLISLPAAFSRDPLVLTGFVIALNLLAVLGTFWLGRRYWGLAAGLLASLLFAVSPWAVQHARGVLGQDLLAPGVVLLMICTLAWFVDGKRWALTAALATLAGLIQVHLAALALAPLLVILLLWELLAQRRQGAAARLWQPLLLGLALGALLYLPYLLADAQQDWINVRGFLAQGGRGRGIQPQVIDLALLNIGGRNIHALAGPLRFREFLAGLPSAAYAPDRLEELLVAGSAIFLAVRLLRRRYDARRARSNALLLLWLATPVLFFLVFSAEVQLHYLVVRYPAPYLALAAAAVELYGLLAGRIGLRRGLTALGGAALLLLVAWQITLVSSIYRFIDQHETPDGWPTPARIVQEAAQTLGQYASLNPGSVVIVLCQGQVPEWDECPAVWTFLASQLPNLRVLDYDDPGFRVYQEAEEALFLLTPGDSLAAAELPALAQALPEADVALREDQGAYRFFRIHNPYRDIASYLEAAAQPGDAVLLVGRDQRAALERFFDGNLPIAELPLPQRDATLSQLEQIAAQQRRLLVLYRAAEESDPEGVVQDWLAEHAYPSREGWLGPVRAVRYVLPGDESSWIVDQPAADFGGQLTLRSAARSGETLAAGDLLALRLDWEATAQPAADVSVFIQLLDADGQVTAQRDLPLHASGAPSSAWQPGQQASTRAAIALPAGMAPGAYRLIAGLYDPQTGTRLPLEGGDFVELGALQVTRAEQPGAAALIAPRFRPAHDFGQVTLESFDRYPQGRADEPSAPVAPGGTLDLLFQWRANQPPTADWALTARLLDAAGREAAAVTGPLAGPRNLSSQWTAGERAAGEHSLLLPADLSPGRYQLQVAVHRPAEPQPAGWLDLGLVEVAP